MSSQTTQIQEAKTCSGCDITLTAENKIICDHCRCYCIECDDDHDYICASWWVHNPSVEDCDCNHCKEKTTCEECGENIIEGETHQECELLFSAYENCRNCYEGGGFCDNCEYSKRYDEMMAANQ